MADLRRCPQCHKRLGQSAIAVHAPRSVILHVMTVCLQLLIIRGEVTHLHCKDSFSRHLADIRG